MTDQVKILRKLSSRKRLEVAFKLSSAVRELALANIKRLHPKAGKMEIRKHLASRLIYG